MNLIHKHTHSLSVLYPHAHKNAFKLANSCLYTSVLIESNYKTSQTMSKSLCIAMNRILNTVRSFIHSFHSKLNSVFCIGLMGACMKWHHTEPTKCVNRSILSGTRNNELIKQRHLFSFLTVLTDCAIAKEWARANSWASQKERGENRGWILGWVGSMRNGKNGIRERV